MSHAASTECTMKPGCNDKKVIKYKIKFAINYLYTLQHFLDVDFEFFSHESQSIQKLQNINLFLQTNRNIADLIHVFPC